MMLLDIRRPAHGQCVLRLYHHNWSYPGDLRWRRRTRLCQGLRLRLQERLPGRDLRHGREECGVLGGPELREDRESRERARLSDGEPGLRGECLPCCVADGLRLQGRLTVLSTRHIKIIFIIIRAGCHKVSWILRCPWHRPSSSSVSG